MQSQPSTRHRKPLRHSIDAILHKTPSFSLSANRNWPPQKPTLPHIETLRRGVTMTGAPLSSLCCWSSTKPDAVVPAGELPPGDGKDSPGELSPQSFTSTSTVSDDQEDVVVVDDETTDMQNEPKEVISLLPKESQTRTPPTSHPSDQRVTLAPGSSPRRPGLPPVSVILPSTRSAFKANTESGADFAKGGLEKAKSAFRPIVRPWLLEKGSAQPCSNTQNPRVPVNRDIFRGVESLSAKEMGLKSLDAISMLRKKSSVFRMAFSNSSRPSMHKTPPTMTVISSPALDNGQPLPSSLSTWFSLLRSGGLHFGGPHPSPAQPFTPGLPPPCRGGGGGGMLSVPAVPSGPFPPTPQPPRYNCEACGKSYSTFGGLSKHKQFHCSAQIKKDFRCRFCDKSYSSLGALKMHIRTHTLPCKCTVCGKAFSRPWLLQGHLRTHTGEKPFSCTHCARAFADRSNLRAHLQTHSDVKKYSCRHCSKTFSRMSLLLKHRESSCRGFLS